jgi:hypothetical protein
MSEAIQSLSVSVKEQAIFGDALVSAEVRAASHPDAGTRPMHGKINLHVAYLT